MWTLPEAKATNLRTLQCPFCQKGLQEFSSFALATRHCPHCGQRIVEEPPTSAAYPFTREQINAACARYRRSASVASWVLLSGFLWLLGSSFILVCFRDSLKEHPFSRETFALVFLLLPFVLVSIAAAIVWDRAVKKGLRCPHCQRCCIANTSRSLHVTQLTGNCGGCGQALTEPPPENTAEPLPSVADFQATLPKESPTWVGYLIVVAWYATLFLIPLTFDPPSPSLEDRYGVQIGTYLVVAIGFVYIILMVGTPTLLIYSWWRRRHRRMQSHPALHCLSCKADLLPRQVVIASRRCPACARRVLQ